jgi:CRP/FNR family transcriptional regulator, cyclic AMP receptor protein
MGVTIDLFRNEAETVPFEEGEVIFREGDPGEAMYVVVEGKVELRIRDKVVEKVGPGGVIGEMALIDRAPRVATATALTDCRLAAIPEKRFLFMVQQTPHFSLQILRVVVERLRRMDEKL